MEIITIGKYIQRQRAARNLFRATRMYYGFNNLDKAPKGLKKLCYYEGVLHGDSAYTDATMLALTRPSARHLHQRDMRDATIDMQIAYKTGGVLNSYADYVCIRRYLYQLSRFSSLYPLTWWWIFHLRL